MIEIVTKYWIEFCLGLIGGSFLYYFKSTYAKNKALYAGMQSLLRDRMIQIHDYYMRRGYAPLHVKDNMTSMYNSYHNLGVNGVMTNSYEEFMELPTEKK